MAIKKVIYISLLLSILFSCRKDAPLWQTDNLNNNEIGSFGHAGMGLAFRYPINSYELFEPCFRIGAKGSEMDVQMTKDSVLVLFHNTKLEDGT